ncbi:MAG: phosphate ABC transporter permease PstA, partial [Gammaproteobacteria bacterium]
RILVKVGNREYLGSDFQWFASTGITDLAYPEEIMEVERREWGNLYGYLAGFKKNGKPETTAEDPWQRLQTLIADVNFVFKQIRQIEKDEIGKINFNMEKLRKKQRALELEGNVSAEMAGSIEAARAAYQQEYDLLTKKLALLYKEFNQYSLVARLGSGAGVDVPLAKVVRAFQPNRMSAPVKAAFYFEKLWEYVSDDPREANTEGGIFPAIFGTVMMVMIMAVLVTPIGVVAAVYLHEYAKQGLLTRIIRIAVNNLAGVPSVVYGVFGLGFFVYFLGGSIDRLFFPEALPAPTFGTPGLLWASLTLSILTVPVVIVSTEEGLSRVPRDLREGSLALGATKAETLWRTVLPMTASAMMTGLILAIARAAGEVAPLMLVGVVKLAPALPLDGNFPFLHLDRKFMHLGFHIYDVGFQSPNVEAARPLVYATALLLVLIVVVLNLTAIRIRNRLREKYRTAEQH